MTENDLLLKDFRPVSMMNAKRTPITKAKFPAIDMHNHLTTIFDLERKNADPKKYLKVMDESGLAAIVNLNGGWGDKLRENINNYDRAYPGRFLTFCNLDFNLIDTPEFKTHVTTTINEGAKLGMRGIKIFKELGLVHRGKDGKIVMPDDDRLRIVWETAAKAKMPVLYHISDPKAFFQPMDGKNELIENLFINTRWHFYGSDFPAHAKLMECQEKMLTKNPDTFFILPHIACTPEDLDYASKLLDTYKNIVFDTSARINDLGRQPYTARKFFIKYADRLLWGQDGAPEHERYIISFRFLETDDEYFYFRTENTKARGRWMIYGLFLPDDVLKKIYYDNTVRVMGKLV